MIFMCGAIVIRYEALWALINIMNTILRGLEHLYVLVSNDFPRSTDKIQGFNELSADRGHIKVPQDRY